MSPNAAAVSAAAAAANAEDPHARDMMQRALQLAQTAAEKGEAPVGAVVYDSAGKVWGEAHNETIARSDISAHAEVLALRRAGRLAGNHRLPNLRMAATLEPCPMCAYAVMQARLRFLHFAAADNKTGACGGVVDLTTQPLLNHHTTFCGGLLAAESARLLRQFFAKRR